MLAGMEDQAEDGRRYALPPDIASFQKARFRRRAQLIDRSINRRTQLAEQLITVCGRIAGLGLARLVMELFWRQCLAAGIRQQAIERANQMANVIADRRGTLSAPQKPGWQSLQGDGRIVESVLQSVSGGIQERRHARDRTAEPGFGL